MEKQKLKVDASIEAATTERGVSILLTGNGKGKSSSAFGMVIRALGYGYKVGVIQFIKGEQLSGEELYLRDHCSEVYFYQINIESQIVEVQFRSVVKLHLNVASSACVHVCDTGLTFMHT